MSIIKKMRFALPLILFLIIVAILARGLRLHPNQVPSPLINKPAPAFELSQLTSKKISTNKDFIGHITLLNVWATWCYACAQEHAFLLELAKNEYLTLYGLNYKDDPASAQKWLEQYGNPYQIVGVDKIGNVAIDLGVYGTPETFIIDKKGVIRYKQIGPITPEIWNQNLKPLVDKLRAE
ncbi:MAG: DsbE family thiol:disulfide interchange protein [Gammaproteobacteria bacterium]